MDNKELSSNLRAQARYSYMPRLLNSAADALEAAEAELTRRDTVIASVRELHHHKHGYDSAGRLYLICDYDKTPWPCKTDALLAAAPVSLEGAPEFFPGTLDALSSLTIRKEN